LNRADPVARSPRAAALGPLERAQEAKIVEEIFAQYLATNPPGRAFFLENLPFVCCYDSGEAADPMAIDDPKAAFQQQYMQEEEKSPLGITVIAGKLAFPKTALPLDNKADANADNSRQYCGIGV
jgi:hypothetical protein